MTDPAPDLRAVVVDDEPLARRVLRALVGEEPGVELVAECASAGEALEVLRLQQPDVVFLDIRMPGMDGLRMLEQIPREERPAIVFTTAYSDYATRAFDEHAVDYLLKPFDDERFRTAIARARERIRAGRLASGGEPELDAANGRFAERLSVHVDGRIDLVEVSELAWVQAADQYVRIHTMESEYLMRSSMKAIEEMLDPRRFLRVHRSAIVALDRVVRMESGIGRTGRVMLRGGDWIPVSRSRISELRRRLTTQERSD